MTNEGGLKRFMTIYNGSLFIGLKNHRIHEQYNEKSFIIEIDKNCKIVLRKEEALKLAQEIQESFK